MPWLYFIVIYGGFPGGSDGKEHTCNAGDLVQFLGQEDSLEKGMATHSSTLASFLHGVRSLVGPSPWGRKELDTTEGLKKKKIEVVTQRIWCLRISKHQSRRKPWRACTLGVKDRCINDCLDDSPWVSAALSVILPAFFTECLWRTKVGVVQGCTCRGASHPSAGSQADVRLRVDQQEFKRCRGSVGFTD